MPAPSYLAQYIVTPMLQSPHDDDSSLSAVFDMNNDVHDSNLANTLQQLPGTVCYCRCK